MKTYFNADPEKVHPQNSIKAEKITNPPLNTPVYLGHDIFFADDLLFYTTLSNPSGSALVSGRDYELFLQDTIASEQSNRRCYRAVLFADKFTSIYADYHAYGDLVQAETINDIQDQATHAIGVAEQTAENLESHEDFKNAHGSTPDESAETLMIRRKDGSVSAGKPKANNDVARMTEVDAEAHARELGDQGLQNAINNEETARTATDIALQENIDVEATSRAESDNTLWADLDDHVTNKANPHGVTAFQTGLGNVPNVATNDQTPTYISATSEQSLSSGEKLGIAFGKIAKMVSSFITHISSNLVHNATSNNVVNTLMARSASGTTQVSSPVGDLDVANKKFVTDLLAGIGVNDVYALSENITAKIWHNGKTVYRTGFYISSLPNTTVVETAFSITGLTCITGMFGLAIEKDTNAKLVLPHPLISLHPVDTDTKFRIRTGRNRSSWEAYIFVEYTK